MASNLPARTYEQLPFGGARFAGLVVQADLFMTEDPNPRAGARFAQLVLDADAIGRENLTWQPRS